MSCSCSDCALPARVLVSGQRRCGTHKLIVSLVGQGQFMAGCHCGAAFPAVLGVPEQAVGWHRAHVMEVRLSATR